MARITSAFRATSCQRAAIQTWRQNIVILTYACMKCNTFKGNNWVAPDPCIQPYGELLEVKIDGQIVSRRDSDKLAQEIIEVLRLNSEKHVRFRRDLLREYADYSPGGRTPNSESLRCSVSPRIPG